MVHHTPGILGTVVIHGMEEPYPVEGRPPRVEFEPTCYRGLLVRSLLVSQRLLKLSERTLGFGFHEMRYRRHLIKEIQSVIDNPDYEDLRSYEKKITKRSLFYGGYRL